MRLEEVKDIVLIKRILTHKDFGGFNKNGVIKFSTQAIKKYIPGYYAGKFNKEINQSNVYCMFWKDNLGVQKFSFVIQEAPLKVRTYFDDMIKDFQTMDITGYLRQVKKELEEDKAKDTAIKAEIENLNKQAEINFKKFLNCKVKEAKKRNEKAQLRRGLTNTTTTATDEGTIFLNLLNYYLYPDKNNKFTTEEKSITTKLTDYIKGLESEAVLGFEFRKIFSKIRTEAINFNTQTVIPTLSSYITGKTGSYNRQVITLPKKVYNNLFEKFNRNVLLRSDATVIYFKEFAECFTPQTFFQQFITTANKNNFIIKVLEK